MKKETAVQILSAPLAALFFYAAFSKLADYDKSRWEMRNQIFPTYVADILTWLIPLAEIMIMLLILFPRTRKRGLKASVFLLSTFTLYILVVMNGALGRIPCSCGGILKDIPFKGHLLFNLVFIGLSIFSLAIETNFNLKKQWFHFFKGKESRKESA